MRWCGARKFSVEADQSRNNSFLAKEMLSLGCTSCLFLNVSEDGYTANITAKI